MVDEEGEPAPLRRACEFSRRCGGAETSRQQAKDTIELNQPKPMRLGLDSYQGGISTVDFRPALRSHLGEDAAGLAATNISRLTSEWEEESRQSQ